MADKRTSFSTVQSALSKLYGKLCFKAIFHLFEPFIDASFYFACAADAFMFCFVLKKLCD